MNRTLMNSFENYKTDLKFKTTMKASDIVLLKGSGNYTWIYFENGSKTLLSKTMHTILEGFPSEAFLRIHKSYSVNLAYIVAQDMRDELVLVMKNGIKAEVSRRKKKEFLSMYNFNCIR